MIISWSHGFAFVHIHKTAGEAVVAALRPHLGPADLVADGDTARGEVVERGRGRLTKHSTAREARDACGAPAWRDLFSFAIVRDPVERAFSLYSYLGRIDASLADQSPLARVAHALPPRRATSPHYWPGMKAYRQSEGFSEFIRHPALRAAPGWKPQWDAVSDGDGSLLVSRLVRFERLDEELEEIWAQFGIPWTGALARVNVSQRSPRPSLDPADLEHLVEHFADDYEHLGFDPLYEPRP